MRPPLSVANYVKFWKYYVGLRTTEDKLRALLAEFRFGTVSEVLDGYGPLRTLRLEGGGLRAVAA